MKKLLLLTLLIPTILYAATTVPWIRNAPNLYIPYPTDMVGFATSTPNAGVHVVSASTTLSTLAIQATTSQTASVLDVWSATGNSLFNVQPSGNVGVGTSTPAQILSVVGNMRLTGGFFDSINASGTVGQILRSTGTSTLWVATSSLGFSTGTVTGTGLIGKVASWLTSSSLGTGVLFDNGVVSGANATSSSFIFNVQATSTSNISPFNVASSTGTSLLNVFANGNVGIGSTTPGSLLSLAGSSAIPVISLTNGFNSTGLSITSSGAAGNPIMITDTTFVPSITITKSTGASVSGNNATGLLFTGTYTHTSNGTNSGRGLDITVSNNTATSGIVYGALISATANTATATAVGISSTVASTNGNKYAGLFMGGAVGIGTTSPLVALTVGTSNTGAGLDSNEVFQFAGGNSTYGTIRGTTNKTYLGLVSTEGFIGTQTSFPFTLRTAGTNRLAIDSTGNVGIATTTPASKLSVLGNASIGATYAGIAAPTSGLIVEGKIGIGSSSPVATFSLTSTAGTKPFLIASSTGVQLFQVDQAGHMSASSTTPVLSSCGTGPTIRGNDNWGEVTVGSVTASGCTITFSTPYINAPSCHVTNQNMSVVNALTYTVSTTALTILQTGLTSAKINYSCFGLNE